MIVADTTLISYFTIEGAFTEEALAVREKDPVWTAPLVTHDGEVLEGFPETAVHPSDFLLHQE